MNTLIHGYQDLIDSNSYKQWKKDHQDAYLYCCFSTDKINVHYAFFSPSKKRVTSFKDNNIEELDSTLLSKSLEDPQQLNLSNIEIDLDKLIVIVEDKFKIDNDISKVANNIITLTKEEKPVWLYTMVTKSLRIFSFKINPVNGEILNENSFDLAKIVNS